MKSDLIVSEFCFENLKFVVFRDVYEPDEDSFLLAKHSKKASGRVLDVGTGCGIQAITCSGREVVGVDINLHAVENARFNAQKSNKPNCIFFESSLFERVDGKFDFILFNPPYLPTSKTDKTRNRQLDKAWNAGVDGRLVINRFLNEFEDFLKPHGRLLLLHSSYAGTNKTIHVLERKGFFVRVLEQQSFPFFEELSVLEAMRK